MKLQVQKLELPKDTAAAMKNRPRNHAHEPDAAAAVNQIDPPPHLHEGKKHTTLNVTRTQRAGSTVAWQAPAGW
jgi:hypothetical protein